MRCSHSSMRAVLLGVAQRGAAPALHRRRRRCSIRKPRSELVVTTRPLLREALDQAARPARVHQPAADAGRQRLADLLQARMHVLVDREHLAVLHARPRRARARSARRGSSARRRGSCPRRTSTAPGGARSRAAGGVVLARQRGDARQAVEVEAGVGRVLVVDRAGARLRAARGCAAAGKSRCTRSSSARTRRDRCGCGSRRRRGAAVAAVLGRSPRRCARAKAAPKAFRLGLTPTPPRSMVASNCARLNGSTPVPASAPNSTALITLPACFGGLRHVEADEALGRRCRRARAARRCRRGRRRSRSSRRSSRRGASRRSASCGRGVTRPRCTARPASISSEASTTSTSPGSGISASTGRPPSASACACGIELDVVDRRAGALRDAGHRGGLREVAVVLAEVDDPVGEHAAALAAHGEDRDLDRLVSCHRCAVRRRSARAALASPRCSQPITAPRTRSRRRSQPLGLLTICAL